MNDPFANGPLLFRPRPEYRRVGFFSAAFFVGMIAFSWSPFFLSANGKGFFAGLGVFATVCFGTFLGMVVQALRETQEPIELDTKGIRFGDRRRSWSHFVEADELTRPEKSVVLHQREGRPVTLRTTAYEDGGEMGRIAMSRIVRATAPLDATRVHRPQGLTLSVFALGMMLVLVLGAVMPQVLSPSVDSGRARAALVQLGFMLPLLLWMALSTLTRYVRLDTQTLTIGTALSRRTVPLASIKAVRTTEYGLAVEAEGRPVELRKGYAGFFELRDRLLALSPAKVEVSSVLPSVASGEQREFGPKPGASGSYAFLVVAGAAFIGFIVSGLGAMGFVMMLVPIVLWIAMLWALVQSRTRILLDDAGIERRGLLGSRRLTWTEIDGAWHQGSTLESYVVRSGKTRIEIVNDLIADMPILRASLDDRLAGARAQAIREAEGTSFGLDTSAWIMFVGVLGTASLAMLVFGLGIGQWMTARPGEEGARTLFGLICAGTGALLLLLVLNVAVRRYVPNAEGLEVRTLKGKRFLRWADVRRAESEFQDTGKREQRRAILRLEHPEGAVRIDGMMTRDLDRLRGYILTHVDASVIRAESSGGPL